MSDYRVVQLYQDGWRLAVVGPAGRKWIHGVVFDCANLSLAKFPKEAERQFKTEPPGKLHRCRLGRVVKILLANGRKYGMTQSAEEFLKEAVKHEAE